MKTEILSVMDLSLLVKLEIAYDIRIVEGFTPTPILSTIKELVQLTRISRSSIINSLSSLKELGFLSLNSTVGRQGGLEIKILKDYRNNAVIKK